MLISLETCAAHIYAVISSKFLSYEAAILCVWLFTLEVRCECWEGYWMRCVCVCARIIAYMYCTALTVDYKKTKLLCVTLYNQVAVANTIVIMTV